MKTTRNYNQGRTKELIENALREATYNTQAKSIDGLGNYKEIDELPENRIFDDSLSLSTNCYNIKTGEVLAICIIRERYLKSIHDGELLDRKHEYNLFRKYATIISEHTKNGVFILSQKELTCPKNCKCKYCFSPIVNDSYQKYTTEDNFRDGFDGDIDSWNHANQ